MAKQQPSWPFVIRPRNQNREQLDQMRSISPPDGFWVMPVMSSVPQRWTCQTTGWRSGGRVRWAACSRRTPPWSAWVCQGTSWASGGSSTCAGLSPPTPSCRTWTSATTTWGNTQVTPGSSRHDVRRCVVTAEIYSLDERGMRTLEWRSDSCGCHTIFTDNKNNIFFYTHFSLPSHIMQAPIAIHCMILKKNIYCDRIVGSCYIEAQ